MIELMKTNSKIECKELGGHVSKRADKSEEIKYKLNVRKNNICVSGGFVLTVTDPQPQSHQEVEDDGLDEDHSEDQHGQSHCVHRRICKQHVPNIKPKTNQSFLKRLNCSVRFNTNLSQPYRHMKSLPQV